MKRLSVLLSNENITLHWSVTCQKDKPESELFSKKLLVAWNYGLDIRNKVGSLDFKVR